jgi:hypothetical protein
MPFSPLSCTCTRIHAHVHAYARVYACVCTRVHVHVKEGTCHNAAFPQKALLLLMPEVCLGLPGGLLFATASCSALLSGYWA